MRKLVPISALLLILLGGCTSANSEIILSDNATVESCVDIEPVETEDSGQEVQETETNKTLVVYVCGAVQSPGVYELPEGSRINDAVTAAGGFSEDADRTYVNLAAKVGDGFKLQIPTLTETADEASVKGIDSFDEGSGTQDAAKSDAGGLININTASREQLVTIPGIGDRIADRIIKYRDENGSFKCIEDIMKVSGIKDKLFSKIKDHITV